MGNTLLVVRKGYRDIDMVCGTSALKEYAKYSIIILIVVLIVRVVGLLLIALVLL